MIQCISEEKPKKWDLALAQAEFSYNNIVNHSTSKSPFTVIYCQPPKLALDLVNLPKHPEKSVTAENMVDHVMSIQEEVKMHLEEATAKYKEAADKKRRKKVFEEGEYVMVYLHKEWFPIGTYNKLKSQEVWPIPNSEAD